MSIKKECKSTSILSERKYNHVCELCGQRFVQTVSFKDHLCSHTGFSYKCTKCTETRHYTSSKAFKKHCDWHDKGEQTYACNTCKKTFESPNGLKSHQATHNEPSLICRKHTDCAKDGGPKAFNFKCEHDLHKKYSKTCKMFMCLTCGGLFTSARTLKIHHLCNGHTGYKNIADDM